MMFSWFFAASAALVTGKRSVLVGDPSSRSPVSVQIFTASLTDTSGSGKPCFQLMDSFMFKHYGEKNDNAELKAGDVQCVELSDQSDEVRAALQHLVAGDMVKLRKSTEFVVKVIHETDGHTKKKGTITEEVKVLRVGNEVSRTPETVQKVTATYIGNENNGKRQLFVNHGMGDSAELACFKTEKSWGYSTKTRLENTAPMLQHGDEFCISPDDTILEVQKIVDQLSFRKPVIINLVTEQVSVGDKTEQEYSVSMEKGAELISSQRAVQHASGTVTQIENGKCCFSVVTTHMYQQIDDYNPPRTHDGASLCFVIYMQNVREQSTIFTLQKGSTVDISWDFDWVSYDGNTAIGEPIIQEIMVFTQSWEKVVVVPQTVQKMTAKYIGEEKPDSAVNMLVNNEGIPADLRCFKVNTSMGFERLSRSDYTKMDIETDFCVRIGDQSPNVQTTLQELKSGTTVTMTWVAELVDYKMIARDGSVWTTTRPQHMSIIADGIETIDAPTSVQAATVKLVNIDDTTSEGLRYCFEVVEVKQIHVAENAHGHTVITQGNTLCFIMAMQNVRIAAKFLTLPVQTPVDVNWGNSWVSYDIGDTTTSTSTNEFIVSKIVVPTQMQKLEFDRTPRIVQKFTAIYKGATQTGVAKMLVNMGTGKLVESSLACFSVKASRGFATANTNWANEELKPNEEFCLNPYDQSPADLITILGLETDALVTVDWVHETVEYNVRADNSGGWKQTFELTHSFMVKKGSEIQSNELTNQEGDVTFEDATVSPDGTREYCFKLVKHGWYTQLNSYDTRIVEKEKLCLYLHLQTAKIQTKLLALPRKCNLVLRWKYVEVYYYSATEEENGADASNFEPIVMEMQRTN